MVLGRVKFDDFEQFWATFSTKGAEKRREYGSRGARPFRNADDENEVVILFDWDYADYKRFLEDPEVPEIFQAAGLQGPPESTPLDPLDEVPS